MKYLLVILVLLVLVSSTHAQVTTNGFQTTTFSNLGSVADGKVRYCTDCTAGNPATGSGTGAYVYRINGVWVGNTMIPGGSGGAPTNATYITQTPNSTLTNEQALSLLSNGLMRVETSTGVITSINNSAGVAANVTDETGSGALVFGTSPTLATPSITTPTITTSVLLNGAVSVTSSSGGNLTIGPTGDLVLDPTGNDILPTTGYDLNLGSIQQKFLTLNAAELIVETLVAQNTLATIGGRILVGPTDILIADLSAIATTVDVKYNNLANGDRVYMEGNSAVEFMAVTSGATPISGGYRYSVTRNLDGSGANAWFAGDAMFNTGTTGDGFIDLYSINGIINGVGPTIVGNVRNSATYNDWSPTWAIGNLNGLYGYVADTYGVALGKYAASNSHITVDSTNGIRILNGTSTVIGQWSTAGVITIGEVGASKDNIQISSGALSIRNNTTERIGITAAGILTIKDSSGNAVMTFDASAGAEITRKLTMPGASSAISIGTTPPASAASGTGIWIDRTGLYGLNASVVQTSINSTGTLTAGGGLVTLSSSGIRLSDTNVAGNSIKWLTSSTPIASMVSFRAAAPNRTFTNIESIGLVGDTTGYAQLLLSSQTAATSTVGPSISMTGYGSAHGTNPNKAVISFDTSTATGHVIMGDGGTLPTPVANTVLELRSTTGALLLSRMTSAERDAMTATNGMLIYNTTTSKAQIRAGGAWVDLH